MIKWVFNFGFGNIDSEDAKKHIQRRRTEKFYADSAKEAKKKAWRIMQISVSRWKRSNAILLGVLSSSESGVFLVRDFGYGNDRRRILKSKGAEECFRKYGS